MLAQLSIRDIVLIDRLDLVFGRGLSVLTGETGAGKSILLDAFSLALGGRGDGGLVRHGQQQGQVTAVFDVTQQHPVRDVMRACELDADGDIILRRVQMSDGRSRAFINDQPVSIQVLRSIGAALVEIHGQHDDRALVDAAMHRSILDAFGGLEAQSGALMAAHLRLKEARTALLRHKSRVEAARQEAEFLKHAADELTRLAVEPAEEARLSERRSAMMQAEKVTQDLADAFDTVGGASSPIPGLSGLVRRLERRGQQAPHLVAPAIAALDAALTSLDEARAALEQALREAAFEPRELERCEERLFALRAAARKYETTVDQLPELAASYSAELEALDAGEAQLLLLEGQLNQAEAEYVGLARHLSAARVATAQRLDAAVLAELAPLKLERARFITQISHDAQNRGPEGFDRVEFWVQTNPGTRAGPMLKVASGGELSRFMLALKVVLADRGSAPTLVFDEIDTGVGGAVADAIGDRLQRLGTGVQVISVTHAPQVAAKAHAHFLIEKQSVDNDRVATGVTLLESQNRREEIARMLAGATITAEARAAATRLLEAADMTR